MLGIALLVSAAAGCGAEIDPPGGGVVVGATPPPGSGTPTVTTDPTPGSATTVADGGAAVDTSAPGVGPVDAGRRRPRDGGAAPDAGAPVGPPSSDAGSAPSDAQAPPAPGPSVCTSGQRSRGTGPLMLAGADCTSCHRFRLAGTVYPTAHEPTGCDGVGGATVIIMDATGQMFTLAANSAGNFFSSGSPTPPLKITVMANGKSRAMVTPAPRANCNSCHSEQGANGAPGRIMLP